MCVCGGGRELLSLRIRERNLVLFGSQSRELTAGLPAVHELPKTLSLVAQTLARTLHSAGCKCSTRFPAPCFGARGEFVCPFSISKLLHARFNSEKLNGMIKFVIGVHTRRQDSSVGIATGYGLGDRGSIPGKDKGSRDFSLLYSIQISCESNPASYPMDTGGPFPGGKAAEA
jgi:hypothetical protein